MSLLWLLIIVLVVLAAVGAPNIGVWKHEYGWGPSGIVSIILIVLLVLLLTGRL